MKREDGKVFQRVEELKQIKKDKDNGKIFCIPFDNYPKLSNFVPGLIPGQMTLITASSGVLEKSNYNFLISFILFIFIL